jgi:hypothetical protein
MNKGKIIIFSIGGIVIILGIIGIIALLSGKSDEKEESITPILNSKDNLTYKDMVEINGTNTNEYVQNHSQKDTLNNIKNQITSIYGVGKNQNTNRSQRYEISYQTPVPETQRNGNYKGKEYEYLYDTPNSSVSSGSSPQPKVEQKTSTTEGMRSWANPNYQINKVGNNNQSNGAKIGKVYKAVISGARQKYITQENNRLSIRVMEPFFVNGVEIPKNMLLVAYANFNEKLTLTINSIHVNGHIIPVNIRVLDSQGQDALEVIGGTGADIGNEVGEEAKNELKTGNNVADKGIRIFSKKRAKLKARISGDLVLLKIEK